MTHPPPPGAPEVLALSFAQVQEIRESFATLTLWTGLPILPERLEGTRMVRGKGIPSLVKFADPMVGPDGVVGLFGCYTPSLRRFAIHPMGEATDLSWRASENTIGVMVNPSTLRPSEFARRCYEFLLAQEAGQPFEAVFLDEPVLWPKTINRPEDLAAVRRAIPDLRPTETVVYAKPLFGESSYVARLVPGRPWRELDWRTADGQPAPLPVPGSALSGWRTWRVLLREFLRHPVPFTLDVEGRRSDGSTRGMLRPAPILLVGATHTGRTGWATGERAEELIPDPGAMGRMLADLAGLTGAELRRGGLAPRTARAMRAGRRPARRNLEAARRIVADRARGEAGLSRGRLRRCLAPGCTTYLSGRQRSFCARHARHPGSRRRAWREAAGR